MEVTQDIPKDHEYYLHSTYYKVYNHGRLRYVMMWNNKDWIRSGKTIAEITPVKKKSVRRHVKPGRVFKTDVVLNAIRRHGAMNKSEIVSNTGVLISSVTSALKDLRAQGKLDLNKYGVYSEPMAWQDSLFDGAIA